MVQQLLFVQGRDYHDCILQSRNPRPCQLRSASDSRPGSFPQEFRLLITTQSLTLNKPRTLHAGPPSLHPPQGGSWLIPISTTRNVKSLESRGYEGRLWRKLPGFKFRLHPLLTGCVSWSKPQFPGLENGNNNTDFAPLIWYADEGEGLDLE